MSTPEMRPVVLVRQLRFCGQAVVIGVVIAVWRPWIGLAVIAVSLLLAVLALVRFRHDSHAPDRPEPRA